MIVSRYETSMTRSIDREGTIHKEMRLLVYSLFTLDTIIEMGTRAIIVMMTNSIDSILVKFAVGVEDVLKNFDVTNGAGSRDCSIKEKLVTGRCVL